MKIVHLSWTPNTEPDLDGYIVYRDGVEVARVPATQPSYVDETVNDDADKACYEVAAYDKKGNVSGRTEPVCKAYPLHLFTITESKHAVTISWDAKSYQGVNACYEPTSITISKA